MSYLFIYEEIDTNMCDHTCQYILASNFQHPIVNNIFANYLRSDTNFELLYNNTYLFLFSWKFGF